MGLSNVKVSPYVSNPVRCFRCQKFGHGNGQCKEKLKCFKCGEEDHEGFDCNNDIMCCNCGQPHMASSKDCHFFKTEKEIQKVKSEKNITYPEARKFVSATNDSPTQKSYASVAKRVFSSVETQTVFTWIEDTDRPTRLTEKPKEKVITPSKKTSSSSQTATTSKTIKSSFSSTSSTQPKNVTNSKSAKGQRSKGPPQGHGKMMKDPVQVHNKQGRSNEYDETIWGVPMDESHSPSRRSPEADRRSRSRRKPRDYSPIRLK